MAQTDTHIGLVSPGIEIVRPGRNFGVRIYHHTGKMNDENIDCIGIVRFYFDKDGKRHIRYRQKMARSKSGTRKINVIDVITFPRNQARDVARAILKMGDVEEHEVEKTIRQLTVKDGLDKLAREIF